MTTAPIYQCAIDARLKPTRLLLQQQLRNFHGQLANRRAECLVLRYMARGWADHQIEALLQRLIDRDTSPRDGRRRHSLARANGWGSAGQCPANPPAKTPAARAQVCHVVAAPRNDRRLDWTGAVDGGDISACVSAQRPREAIA